MKHLDLKIIQVDLFLHNNKLINNNTNNHINNLTLNHTHNKCHLNHNHNHIHTHNKTHTIHKKIQLTYLSSIIHVVQVI